MQRFRKFSASLFWPYVAIIVLAPLPFGGVHSLSQAFFATCFLLLASLWNLGQAFVFTGTRADLRRIWPEAVCFTLVLGWIGLQEAPILSEFGGNPLWWEVTATLGSVPDPGALTLVRSSAIESLLRLATYGAVFWLAFQFGQDQRYAKRLLMAVAISGTVYAIYGLVVHWGGFERVLWVEHTVTRRDLSATLINRNSYATLAGLSLLCAIGLYQASLERGLESKRTGRDRLGFLLHHAFSKGAVMLTSILVLLTALFLTHSRAGVTCGLIGLFCLMYLAHVRWRKKSWISRGLALCLPVGLLVAYLLSGEGWQHRLVGTDLEKEGRLVMYEQVWQAIQAAPWNGYGAGSFASVFPMFADELTSHWDKAHNDWLETLFDLGWPAGLLWFATLFGLCFRCLAGAFRRKRDRVYSMVGCSAGLLVGLHSFVDFSLQIPAVAITFAVLLGVGVGQSWSSQKPSAGYRTT